MESSKILTMLWLIHLGGKGNPHEGSARRIVALRGSTKIHPDMLDLRFFCISGYKTVLCQKKECVRQIFTERVPGVVAPYARRTMRVGDLFTLIGFALGGEAGKRLVLAPV